MKIDLALNNLQWLICHQTKPNPKPKPKFSFVKIFFRALSDF